MFGIDDLGAAIGGIAGAGASIFGGASQNAANKQNAQDQFFYNLMLQQQAQGFNERMANTQYQRTMADMRAGGLNPILAAGGFSPDSASGGHNSVSQVHSENVGAGVANSAATLGKMLAELKQIDQHVSESKAREGQTRNATLDPGQAVRESSGRASASESAADASRASAGLSKQATRTEVARTQREEQTAGREKLVGPGSLTNAQTWVPSAKEAYDFIQKNRGKLMPHITFGPPSSDHTPSSAQDMHRRAQSLDVREHMKRKAIQDWDRNSK